ncbi:MAG: PEP-CTERM sorting domain-containing protein [Alphaproteobacteria bacterium]|nr:PEP-CTERM sorting domain-containing protein [Alphaproteobacteria bacterium]
MLKIARVAAAAALAMTLGTSAAQAAICGTVDGITISVSLHGSNVGMSSVSCTYSGSDEDDDLLTIKEVWSNTGIGILEITMVDASGNPTPRDTINVRKEIDNQSGVDWTRLANELLDPGIDPDDPAPQPGFVPAGFSTSDDTDGLSFDQFGSIPRVSNKFADVFADELTDARDFLDFFNGTLANGSTDGVVEFGLDTGSTTLPFLLVQRPNTASIDVPAPATLLLFGTAIAAAAGLRRLARRA